MEVMALEAGKVKFQEDLDLSQPAPPDLLQLVQDLQRRQMQCRLPSSTHSASAFLEHD